MNIIPCQYLDVSELHNSALLRSCKQSIFHLDRRGQGSQNQQDKDSVGSSSQCSGQDSSASSQVDLGQARAGQGSFTTFGGHGSGHTRSGSGGATEKDSTLRKPIIRITEHSPEARGEKFLSRLVSL